MSQIEVFTRLSSCQGAPLRGRWDGPRDWSLSDLYFEDILFFVCDDGVNSPDTLADQFLGLLLGPVHLVGASAALGIDRRRQIEGIVTALTNGHLALLADFLGQLHHLFAPLLCKWRNRKPNQLSVGLGI